MTVSSSAAAVFLLSAAALFISAYGFPRRRNEIAGYDVDLAKEAARRMGIELVLQPIDWNAKEQELNTREIDCIWNGFTITEERKQALTYTRPYLT